MRHALTIPSPVALPDLRRLLESLDDGAYRDAEVRSGPGALEVWRRPVEPILGTLDVEDL